MTLTTFSLLAVLLPVLIASMFYKHYWKRQRYTPDFEGAAATWIGFLILAAAATTLPTVVMANLYNGLMPTYSIGQRDGYITKMSCKGVIFKTWECEMQVGSGQQAALQAPWAFSIPASLTGAVELAQGKHVRVRYGEWLILPSRLGKSSYLATSIEISPPAVPPVGNAEPRR